MDKFPVIQVALDFTELKRAIKVAQEVVKGGIDWIEVGTPLIKSTGVEAIRQIKKEFPNKKIIADMKIMDAGRLESEIAFKSGADIVVVLGNASDQTIKECVSAGENYGGKVMVDLMEESANLKRAKEVEKLGVDYISVHTPIDEQMTGNISFDIVKDIAKNIKIPVAVAGGLNSENISDAIKSGASILIVGGAITKSENVENEVKKLKEAVKKLKKIPSLYYKRVKKGNIREVLLKVSTDNISDALHRGGWLKDISPVLGRQFKMAGKAITVRTFPGDWAKPVEAIDISEKGDVIVIDAGGVSPAVWGELATSSAKVKGVSGVVIYGYIRDVEEIIEMNFPSFAVGITPQAGEPKGFGEINVPIKIGGQVVKPGDWIVGDIDGVVVIPEEKVVEITNRAMDVFERENRIRKEIKDGSTLSSVAELLRWEKTK
ncbi:MAG TPA: DUF561 domain-containing protein [bacterium]|nr:DUF561 domain-containing protein [bacterium]